MHDYKFPHIRLPDTNTSNEKYKSRTGGGGKFVIFGCDRKAHYEKLKRQLLELEKDLVKNVNQRNAVGISDNDGITVTFVSEPSFELQYNSLEFRPAKIELLNFKKVGDVSLATVFVPEGKIKIFLNRLEAYVSEARRHEKLFSNISEIKKATLEALWTDEASLLPTNNQPIWWEVWIRSGDNNKEMMSYFKSNASKVGLKNGDNEIYFPERAVILVYGTKEDILKSVDLLNCIAELRRAKDSPEYFMGIDHEEERNWISDALNRIQSEQRDNIAILLLDTGVNRAHPLISPFLAENDLHTHDAQWSLHDEAGHGTGMAGLALYGDLVVPLASNEPIKIGHVIESGKIIRKNGKDNRPDLYGAITSQIISKAAMQAPHRKRIISLAVTSQEHKERGRPSSWSSEIDNITSGYSDDEQKLMIIAAGNSARDNRHLYPDNVLTEELHDPSQAWNAITAGAFTEKNITNKPEYTPIVQSGDVSTASTTSLTWQEQWPLKPDIVFEGGNWAKKRSDNNTHELEELRLLTTHHDFTRHDLTVTGDTSAAAAQVARMAAQIQREYPNYRPETIRALLVHSANWTPAMLKRWEIDLDSKSINKSAVRNLIRCCGYGVPNLERALRCAENDLTLVIEGTLQPFDKVENKSTMGEMNFHKIPWPVDILEGLGSAPVNMKITLSYFIESNPGDRGWKKRYSYASHGLRFDINMPTEKKSQFRKFINKIARDEEDGLSIVRERDSDSWLLGQKLRHRGSIHSDIWRGTASDLAQRQHIAVYPVIGWWRERPQLEKWNSKAHYSLAVSISTPIEDVQLYTEIVNRIGVAIAI